MKKLNLPAYNFKFKTVNQKTQIFDSIRKKYIALTPEEWVRQNFICFLVEEKKYPASLIAVESGLKYLSQKKRTDIVIYSNVGKPIVIVECKAPEVAIKEETFEQISRYNSTFKLTWA
jgi:type I site-specific restriction-modification system R (restriction) subunit